MIGQFSRRSVQQLAQLYFESLLGTLIFIRDQQQRTDRKPPITETMRHLHRLTNRHGVHRFPALCVANGVALSSLMPSVARSLGFNVDLSHLSVAERTEVEQTFADAIVLDASLHETTPVTTNMVEGFALDRVFCGVAVLHCIKGTLVL